MRVPTYRELMRFSAFREWVSQRSVRASSSALSCSQVSLLGAPIKPADKENKGGEAPVSERVERGWGQGKRVPLPYLEVSNQMKPKVDFNPVILILLWDRLIDQYIY